jgi:LemA protein
MPSFYLVIVFTLLLTFLIRSYNLLIRDKKRVEAAWSDINVQLARRHALIPKLIVVAETYANFERKTLTQLTRLRAESLSNPLPTHKSFIEHQLSEDLHQLLITLESYPDIKANQHYLNLQLNLSEIETAIQAARRFYNGAVRNFNIRIDHFPDLILAKLMNFQPANFFTLNSTQPNG